jgi:hypothetical protein
MNTQEEEIIAVVRSLNYSMSKPREKTRRTALERDLRLIASRLNNLDIGKRLRQLPNQMTQKMSKLDQTN